MASRFPKFTNEVQHQSKVLAWCIDSLAKMNEFSLPSYTPRDYRTGKSQQLWIARHRPWSGS